MAPVVGSFLGEVMVRELAGTWAVDENGVPGVVFGSGAWVYPHQKATRRLASGHEDSLAHYYDAVAETLATP